MANLSKHVVSRFLQRRQRGTLTNRSPGKRLRLHFERLEERNLLSHTVDLVGVLYAFEDASFAADLASRAQQLGRFDSATLFSATSSAFSTTITDGTLLGSPSGGLTVCAAFTIFGDGGCSNVIVGTPVISRPAPSAPVVVSDPIIEPEEPAPLPPPQAEILLDPTFGTGGIVTTEVRHTAGARVAALQADGKILVAGYGISDAVMLARYNPDGSLDTSFGDAGVSVVDMGFDFSSWDLALQADGGIVVVGFSWGTMDFMTTRFTAQGELDASFGDGGVVQTRFSEYDNALAVAIQPDGKILVGGNGGHDFALVRYNPDGSFDTSFAKGGVATGAVGGSPVGSIKDIAIQDDGKILVAAGKALLRFHSDGSLDAGFGNGGVVDASGTELVLQDDGRFVVLSEGTISRYNADGSLDTSFGGNGSVSTGIRRGGSSIALDAQGNVVVVGTEKNPGSHLDFAVARFNPDGSPDGNATTDMNSVYDQAHAVIVLADGSIVVAGGYQVGWGSGNGGSEGIALARYQVIEAEVDSSKAESETLSFLALSQNVFEPMTFDTLSTLENEPDTPRPDAVQDETVDLALTELTSDDEQDGATGYLGGGRIETPQIVPADEVLMPDSSLLPPVVNQLLGISG